MKNPNKLLHTINNGEGENRKTGILIVRFFHSQILILLTFVFVLPYPAKADDTGLVKVRLLEDSIGVYVMEVDIASQLLGFISYPELPERFSGTERTEFEGEGSFITVKYFFSCPNNPLNSDDVIILDWNRRGVSLTAQWFDEEYIRSFFTRGSEGFSIPIKRLRSETESSTDLAKRQFLSGINHPYSSLSYLLLLVFLIIFARRINSLNILISIFMGHAFSLILVETGITGIPIGVVELQSLVAIIITLTVLNDSKNNKNLLAMFFVLGTLYGLGFGLAQKDLGIPINDNLVSSLFFHLGLDISLLLVYLIVLWILKKFNSHEHIRYTERILFYGVGSTAVLFLLITFNNIQSNAVFYSLNFPEDKEADKISIPEGITGTTPIVSKPKPIIALEYPLETFLTIEPFEVRFEVLVDVSELDIWLGNDYSFNEEIDVGEQDALIEDLLLYISKSSIIELDEEETNPAFKRGDFVTLSSTGIFTREEAVPEQIEQATIGLKYVYEYNGLPEKVKFRWKGFKQNFPKMSITSSDPFGGDRVILTDNENTYEWTNKLKGYRIPQIKPVEVTAYPLPLISFLIFIIIGLFILIIKYKKESINESVKIVIAGLLIVAFLIYPFIRFSVNLPFIDTWKPNVQAAVPLSDALLTNVYRSIDLRDEEAVYDRLALTVYGDQLTEIYLQSRKSMELENRGGARGKVDDVEILEIKSVKDLEDNRIAIELIWKVSGSVTHFGHTHYRQNKNYAVMTILPINEIWKVEAIDIIDEARIL